MSMSVPPFKLATSALAAASGPLGAGFRPAHECCESADVAADDAAPTSGRARLLDLNSHLHCSVIGTCLGTPELRKLMARFIDAQGLSDLDVHHEAVRLAGVSGPTTKALHKALDKRHEATLQRFKRARGEQALTQLWEERLRQGEVPGAYWAVLTHRDVTADLRQRVFGDVHMLSHLVGAANRADIRRLVALEAENAELRDKLEQQQLRSQQLLDERDAATARLLRQETEHALRELRDAPAQGPAADLDALNAAVAVQTTRREHAESEAAAAARESERLAEELSRLRLHAEALGRELHAAEVQLRESSDLGADAPRALTASLKDRRILYVGGRPSSTPAIRDLVLRHGGDFQRHDGGLEDRKGLLESAVAWAELVIFPVDCIDHDSASRLKRLCMKQGTPFVPLRSAGVASFAAAIADLDMTASLGQEPRRPTICLRHG